MEIVLVILSLIVGVCGYVIYNMYTKYNELEKVAMENQEFILAIQKRVMSQRSYLKQIDRAGSFEADDEVGYFFKELKKIINDISSYFEIEQQQEDESKESIVSRITKI